MVQDVQKDRVLVPSTECNGNACEDVAINYLGPGHGYLFKNLGSRRVGLRIQWSVGWSCLEPSNYELNPGETKRSNLTYCDTVEANYI